MKIQAIHSHLNGLEWLMIHQNKVLSEIKSIIRSVDAKPTKTKVCRKKTMPGRMHYSPKALNLSIKELFSAKEWSAARTSPWVKDNYKPISKTLRMSAKEQHAAIEEAGKRPIRSYNQTDFVKNRVAVEVQFGKYSFVAYDLFVKHLAFFVGDSIDVGVEVVPMKSMQEQMSSGPYYYEATLYDLARQGRGAPPVPLVIIGVTA